MRAFMFERSMLLLFSAVTYPAAGQGFWTFGGFRGDGLLRLPGENTSSF